MFDATFDLEDLKAADATLELLVQPVGRARDAGRFSADPVPLELAIQSWTARLHRGVGRTINAGQLTWTRLTGAVRAR